MSKKNKPTVTETPVVDPAVGMAPTPASENVAPAPGEPGPGVETPTYHAETLPLKTEVPKEEASATEGEVKVIFTGSLEKTVTAKVGQKLEDIAELGGYTLRDEKGHTVAKSRVLTAGDLKISVAPAAKRG